MDICVHAVLVMLIKTTLDIWDVVHTLVTPM